MRSFIIKKYCKGAGLDVGCGSNPLTQKGVVTMDIREQKNTEIDYICPCDKIPVRDDTFDFIYASHVLEHVFNPVKALIEWKRVLKPAGRLILIMPDCRFWINDRKIFDIPGLRSKKLAGLDLLVKCFNSNYPNYPPGWRNYKFWHGLYYKHKYLWRLYHAEVLLNYLGFNIIFSYENDESFLKIFDKALLDKYKNRVYDDKYEKDFYEDITELQEINNYDRLDYSFYIAAGAEKRRGANLKCSKQKNPFFFVKNVLLDNLTYQIKTIDSLSSFRIKMGNLRYVLKK